MQIEKLKKTWNKRHQLYGDLMMKGFKQVMLDECGAVTMSKIGYEAIGILVLVVIYAIIPSVGVIITTNLHSNLTGTEWENSPSAAELWTQTAPMLQACIVIVIVGLILKVIYDLRKGNP